ncbi:hypothetical protein [Pseudogemmobacter sonorensis]|uniref:hypothetical protein n=1 Tax=Pseudogemmobacter sonorensis TaxID=2989681 RepID=UPI00368FD3D1
MPKLIRLYILSVAIGFAISAGFVAVLLWLDLAGVGRLILGSSLGWVAAIMMVTFFGVMFSGVQFAIRIMMMAEPGEGPRGGQRQHVRPLRAGPVPVSAPAAGRRPGRG